MDARNLTQMANRIAEFFAVMPDQPEAVDGVANHIDKFWEPRMRRQLLQIGGGSERDDLHPLVLQALPRVRD